jgi:hypothetical protein
MKLLAIGAAIALAAGTASADVIKLPGDRTVTVEGFQVETQNATGVKTLILNMTPNFDPEPDGEVPADDYARVHELLCNAMARSNAKLIEKDGITRFRAKWKWTPEQKPENKAAGITITRSHQSDFELDDAMVCTPVPNEVRPQDIAITTPTGLPVRLRYIETSRKTGNLDLNYEIEAPLEETDDALLSNASKELCILHADGVLAHRAKYYKQLDYQMVSIAFTQEEPSARTRGFLYQVENGACATGLSPELVKAIRGE